MKRYSVARVRERLSEALDSADRGEAVLIERRGVMYRLTVERAPKRGGRQRPQIEVLDKAVEAGSWTWHWRGGGLALRTRRR